MQAAILCKINISYMQSLLMYNYDISEQKHFAFLNITNVFLTLIF